MEKKKIKPEQLMKLLDAHDLKIYDVCKICGVAAITAERWKKAGIPEPQYRLIALSLGDL